MANDVMKRADSRFLASFLDNKISADYHKHLYHYYEEGAHTTYKTEMNAHIFRVSKACWIFRLHTSINENVL